MTNLSHEHRIAVVTGAARGIGQAICRQLAARGATVVAVDLDEPSETLTLLAEAGHKATGICADIALAENLIHAAHAAWRYSWSTPPSRSHRRT
jgi:NAD(P)-dependent dehydrogenase (short-subunit alcohol dehydrogenase family)